MPADADARGGRPIDRVLAVAVALWAVLCLGWTVVAIVELTAGALTPCDTGECRLPQLSHEAAESAAAGALGLTGFAIIVAIVSAITALVPAVLGTIVAVWGRGRVRYAMAAVWFALAFGAFSGWAPVPSLGWVITPIGLAGLFWLLAAFPGSVPDPRWTAIPVGVLAIWAVIIFGIPSVVEAVAQAQTPWSQLVGPVFIGGTIAIVIGKATRARSATPGIRRWYGLLVVAIAIMIATGVGGAVLAFLPNSGYGSREAAAGSLLSNLSTAALFAVLAAASLRDGGYDVRPALNHVLFGAILVGIAVIAYSVTVLLVSSVTSGWVPPALAAVITALALAAVFAKLARAIDRLVYGDAAEPGALVAAMTAELAVATDSGEAVPALLRRLVQRLRLSSATLELPDGERIAAAVAVDDRPLGSEQVELRLPDGSTLACLTIGLRPGQHKLSRRDRLAIRAAAAPVQAALAARRLAETAAGAGRALATVRESERRTLRRQLHDDVGPDLAIAKQHVSAARRDLAVDAGATGTHLDRAARAISLGLDRVRAISRELRPPALDDGGLMAALRRVAEDSGLRFEGLPTAPEGLGDAYEVVLYRIGAEAITNAARHGGARSVRVTLEQADGWTGLEVADDGEGLPMPVVAGVGMTSMRERVGELGGTVSFGRAADGGALVTCRLPVVVVTRDSS
jgi:signal transduction histidine kinase